MRILIIIILLISFNTLSQSIKSTYLISHKSKTSTYVLQLKDSNKFEVIDFIKNSEATLPISMVDTGTYSIKNVLGLKFIKFKSVKKYKIVFILNDKTYFIKDDKLWEKPFDLFLKKKYKAILTNDTVYVKTINFKTIRKSVDIKKDFTKTFFLNNIKKYSPSYLSVIESSYCGPGCYLSVVNNKTLSWDEDTTYKRLINDYTTMVHETTHKHNGSDGYDWEKGFWNGRALIEPGITISYSPTPTFHSELFITIVPKEAPKKIFRYGTYVARGSEPSANVCGIYGLMDEFSAYRNATRCAIEGTNTAIKLKDTEKIAIFQQHAIGQYFAYYEFRLFIAWYLEYAEKNKPDIYKKIMVNTNLRISYTLLDDGFQNDIKDLQILVKKYPSYNFEYNEKEYAQYVKDLLVSHEKTLTKFRIEGVNKENYKEKLK
jgi:hypothetical protein